MNIQPRLQRCTCPTCGGYLGEAAPLEAVRERISSGLTMTIYDVLSRSSGRLVSPDAILGAMYGGSADGGPLNANAVLHVTVSRLKKQIEPFGWTISSVGRGSGNRASYRLIPMEAGQ